MYTCILSGTRKRPRRCLIVFSNYIPNVRQLQKITIVVVFVFSNEEHFFLSFSQNIKESFVGLE